LNSGLEVRTQKVLEFSESISQDLGPVQPQRLEGFKPLGLHQFLSLLNSKINLLEIAWDHNYHHCHWLHFLKLPNDTAVSEQMHTVQPTAA
jgi:hypothetical protein